MKAVHNGINTKLNRMNTNRLKVKSITKENTNKVIKNGNNKNK